MPSKRENAKSGSSSLVFTTSAYIEVPDELGRGNAGWRAVKGYFFVLQTEAHTLCAHKPQLDDTTL
jgi:hypothetical protein